MNWTNEYPTQFSGINFDTIQTQHFIMKHSILHCLRKAAFFSALATMPAIASAQGNSVVMLAKDGTTYELALDRVSTIDFKSTEVLLNGKGGEVKAMPYADIKKIIIGSDGAGLTELTANGEIAVWPSPTTGPLQITGVETGTRILAYDQKGILVASATAADTTVALDITNATTGIVVLKIGDKTVKVIKK